MKGFHPFSAIDPRVRNTRAALVAATMSGMLFCVPLWLGARPYPLVPLFPGWLILPAICGPCLLGLALFSLVAAIRFFRPATAFYLLATLYLYGCDQNRGQPWIYMYWVMLLLNLLPERTALASCRIALSIVYFWAGIQKLNGGFFDSVPAWFIQPAVDWGLPHVLVAGLRTSVALTPFYEIFISMAVWHSKTRWLVIGLAAIIHIMALLLLGPLGHNINLVIWPWNLAMIVLLLVLFGSKECASLPGAWSELRRSGLSLLIVTLFGLLPLLCFFGCWDSYFSFALYSGNLSRADVYLSQPFAKRLPARLQPFVYPVKNYNSTSPYQKPYMFEHVLWGTAELGTPPLPEPRGYTVMFRYIAAYATNSNDCSMLIQTRSGKILMYQAGVIQPVLLQ
jgi:hypothetical protein